MRGCQLGSLLSRMKDDIRQEVEYVLTERPDISAAAVSRALAKHGFNDVPRGPVIVRHRKGVCACNDGSES